MPVDNQETSDKPLGLRIWLPLLLSIALVVGMFIGLSMQKTPHIVKVDDKLDAPITTRIETGRVEELIRYIEAKYVDDVDREKLVEKAINNILKELDPHSNYITSKQLKEVNEQLDGNFEGVGIEFMMLEDTVLVVSPISGGPSEQAGIMAGDRIVEIEDTVVAGVELEVKDIVSKLRGVKGSEVRVGCLRNQENKLRKFTIVRDEIPLISVDVGHMLNDDTGYIKISRFSATTYQEFMKKLEYLVEKKNMKHLVIDVRQNPGGYLQEATKLLSQLFQERDRLLVYTEGRTVHRNDYESTGKSFFELGNIAVLIDEGSASASEILAGAVQDWDRGILIGRRSFGKGLVQEQYELSDGSALRLTVARYFTPSGRSIQKSYNDLEKYNSDVYERYQSGELVSADSIHIADTTKFYTAQNRIVYGGGGITPDVFVPMDTVTINDYYLSIRQHVPQFIYRYVDQHRQELEYTNIDDFKAGYSVSDEALEELLQYAATKDVERDEEALMKSKDGLKLLFKARVARSLFNDEGYFSVLNDEDPIVKTALKQLKKTSPLTIRNK